MVGEQQILCVPPQSEIQSNVDQLTVPVSDVNGNSEIGYKSQYSNPFAIVNNC